MLYDAKLAQIFAQDMLDKGIYVVGFSYPVVPKEEARIRVKKQQPRLIKIKTMKQTEASTSKIPYQEENF